VDAKFIVLAALSALARQGAITADVVKNAINELGINVEKPSPMFA
jgi:pyruvate dehydrogenase E1 component